MTERRAAVTHLHGPLGGPPLQTELRHRGAVAGGRLTDGQKKEKNKRAGTTFSSEIENSVR